MKRARAQDENSIVYLRFICFFVVGCILGVIIAKFLPYSMAEKAILQVRLLAERSKLSICFCIFFKSIIWPSIILILSYFNLERAIPFAFFLMGAFVACEGSLCAISGGVGGYFASIMCNMAINFIVIVSALIIGTSVVKSPRKRARNELSAQAGAAFVVICAFLLVFAIIASFISPLFVNAALYLIK